MDASTLPQGFYDMLDFGLLEAITGRRARRFFMGAEIPDGIFQYKSRHAPLPLSELETLIVVTACGGNTGWHHMIKRGARYAPYLSNYSGSGAGRVFPSAAGFEASKTFFTNDEGVFVLDVNEGPALIERNERGELDPMEFLQRNRTRIRKLSDGRVKVPPEVPYVEAHNTWVVNRPGTLLVIPIGDLAQHVLLVLCYLLQNGFVVRDDINGRAVPGIEKFRDIVDPENVWPLSFVEQFAMAEMSVELGASCYAGALTLQAMGLGGWMFNGIDPFVMLGASGEEEAPGLGFRYDSDERWSVPNPTGLAGVMEGFCPPHYADMRAAVDALCERKFGKGGPFHPGTPGPWRETAKVRGAAQVHDERFRQCVALQAQYLYDAFGKFPATVPSIFSLMYLQAHHLDLEFYDRFYEKGAYLPSHAEHMEKWHEQA